MILVVDDYRDAAHFLSRILARQGYECAVAYDGDEALEFLKHSRPQAMILDIAMPRVGGLEVLAAMNADPQLKPIPVIVYSAGHEREQEEASLNLGARAYLVKGSVDLNMILEHVARYATPQ